MNVLDSEVETVNLAVETLISVVYVSSAKHEFEAAELTELLTHTRENNKRRGITGMLLYRGGNFLQVIEGPQSAIDALLKVLRRDRRHDGIIVMKRTKIDKRQFADWQMAYQDITHADLSQMPGYSPFMELSFKDAAFRAEPSLCYRLLLQFKEKIR